MRYSAFLIVSTLCISAASGQTLDWGTQQSIGNAGQDALRPRMDMGTNGPVVLWGQPPSSMYVTMDQGAGFLDPIQVQPPGVQPWATSWAGGDLCAHGDTVVAVYSTGSQGVGILYASRSIDGGLTWPDTVRIAPLPGLEARFPTVTYVPGQGPVVQYMEFDPNWSDPRYVVATSLDGGVSYGDPIPVSAPYAPGEVCDCCTGEVISAGDDVLAMFRNNDSNLRTMWAAVSSDGGNSFPAGGEIDQTGWLFNACSSSGPDGYIAGDSVRYVWMSGAANGTKVYYGSALLSTLEVGANALVHAGQSNILQQNYPRIAGQGDTLGIVWEQNLQGDRNILFSWSVTGWAGLSAPDTVNLEIAGSQRTPDVAFKNGVFHFVWEEPAVGTLGYRSASIEAGSGVGVQEQIIPLHMWPNPAGDVLQLLVPVGTRSIVVNDATGRTVLRSNAVSTLLTDALPPGVYTVRCIALDGRNVGMGRFMR